VVVDPAKLIPGAAALLIRETVDDHGEAGRGSELTIEPTTMAVATVVAVTAAAVATG
jgi:hypothetical protein